MTDHNAFSSGGLQRWVVTAAACIAGAITMMIQIVVTRIAIHSFGAGTTTIASMIVMSLVGLSAGSYCIGGQSSKWARLERVVAMLFLGCAGLICLFILFQSKIELIIFDAIVSSSLRQFAFAAITMLPVNFLLGGVLPLLIQRRYCQMESGSQDPSIFGGVYAAETVGAAIGALVAGFLFIQTIGLQNSLIICGVLASIFGLICWLFSKPIHCHPGKVLRDIESAESNRELKSIRGALFLGIVAMVGCASLGMEVIWQRILVILFGSDTKSYSLVAATYLIGIGFGAFVSRWFLEKFGRSLLVYGFLLLAIAIAIVVSTHFVIFEIADDQSARWSSELLVEYPVLMRTLFGFCVLIVPTTLIGVGFAYAGAIWIGDTKKPGREAAKIYSAVLFGNVVGVLLCGFWLVPIFGLKVSCVGLSAMCLIGALGAFWPGITGVTEGSKSFEARIGIGRMAIWFAVGMAGVWLAFANQTLSENTVLGLYSDEDWSVDYYREGTANTVAVFRSNESPEKRKMIIDGVSIGESGGGVDEKQQLLAHLPFLLRAQSVVQSETQSVLTIGLGTGILCGELLERDEVADVCCVELSPEVIEAAGEFSDLNGRIFQNEKFKLAQEDGIQFLKQSESKYNVIVSDAKSRPGHAGNIAFFSREYYELCNERLSTDGIFVQWISLHTHEDAIAVILNSFSGCFPFGHVAIASPDSLFVVGTRQALQLNQGHINKYLSNKKANSLARYDWKSFDDILSMYWLDQESIEHAALLDSKFNSFDRPVLESFALKSYPYDANRFPVDQLQQMKGLIQFDVAGDIKDSRINSSSLSNIEIESVRNRLVNARLACQFMIDGAIRMSRLDGNWLDESATQFKSAVKLLPELNRQKFVIDIYRQIQQNAKESGDENKEFSALMNISELAADSGMAKAKDIFRLGQILSGRGKHDQALDYFYRATKIADSNQDFYRCEFGFCLLQLDKSHQAAAQFEKVLRRSNEVALAKIGLGIAKLLTGQSSGGQDLIDAAIEAEPELKSRLSEFGIDRTE